MRYRFVMQDGQMDLVVTGGTGVLGRAAVRSLVAAGHRVRVICRSAENITRVEALGAEPQLAALFDARALAVVARGADAVVNLAVSVPVGYAALVPRHWKRSDELWVRASAAVVEAARIAGARRVVQASLSSLYADGGDAWITEECPLDITAATEPAAVAEARAQEYAGGFRAGVVLRFGMVVGDDPQTRFWLRGAGRGRPIGIGDPGGWAHVIHSDDIGPAVLAALDAPSGVYNVGAAPVLRHELVDGFTKASGAEGGGFMGPVLRRFAGARAEPMARSLRVASDLFTSQTGWTPARPAFDPAWLDAALPDAEEQGAR